MNQPDHPTQAGMPDTPLDEEAKAHILGQLDEAAKRFVAVLDDGWDR